MVNIAVEQPSPAEQNPLLQDPFFRRYMGVPDSALQPIIIRGFGRHRRRCARAGHHQLPRRPECPSVEVGLKDGRHFPAEPVALAPRLDLAVLRIGARDLPSLKLGDSNKLEVGDYVVAIGNPFGIGQTVTGHRQRDRPHAGTIRSAAVHPDRCADQPGQLRRPADDLQGEVVGINSALFSPDRGKGNVGIGFAIPANVVRQVLAEAEKAK